MANGVEITGATETHAMIVSVSSRMKNLGPVMDLIGFDLERSMLKTIQVGGRPDKWKPTIRSTWGNYKALSISGTLKRMTHKTSATEVEAAPTKESQRYAATQNFGATITPKNVKALPVPLNEEARKAQANAGSVRNIKGLAYIPSKKGGKSVGILAKTVKRGNATRGTKKGDIIPMFALVKSITVPKREFALVQDEDVKLIEKRISRYITEGEL